MDKLPDVPLPVPETPPKDGQPQPKAAMPARPATVPAPKRQKSHDLAVQARPNRRPVMWGVLTVVAALAVAGGVYAFWCFYQVSLATRNFQELYGEVDKALIRTYAGPQWEAVERGKADAEHGSWLLDTKAKCTAYQTAGKAILAARDLANESKKRHTDLRAHFDELWKEAEQQGIRQHAESIAKRIETLLREAGEEKDSTFAPDVACAKLKEAIAILDESRKSYDLIKVYDLCRTAFETLHKQMKREELAHSAPDLLDTLDSLIPRAEAAAGASRWQEAADAYRQAADLLRDGLGKVQSGRQTADETVARLEKAVKGANRRELETNAKAAWAKITERQGTVARSMAQADYAGAVTAAEAALKLLQDTQEKVTEAKAKRDQIIADVDKAYEATAPYRSLLKRNWKDAWAGVEALYKEVQALAKTDDYVELLEKAGALKTQMAKLDEERLGATTGLAQTQQAFEALMAQVTPADMSLNAAELWGKVQERRKAAAEAVQQENSKAAVQAYTEATDLLRKARDEAAQVKAAATKLREQTRTEAAACRRGIQTFEPAIQGRLDAAMARGETSWTGGNYRGAQAAYEEAAKLLPAGRFVRRPDGTVIDYRDALMWASDGAGPGCNDGKPTDWDSAVKWVSQLRLGQYGDWRLPTDEELQGLTQLPAEALAAAFPNTRPAKYWTRTTSTADVNRVYTVDLGSGKTVQEDRKTPCHMRPVRTVR